MAEDIITCPLYGVVLNYHGICEKRYLYNAYQLLTFDATLKGRTEVPDSYEGCFRADETYEVVRLSTEEEVKEFIKGTNYRECDCDDPELDLLAEWYSLFTVRDLWFEDCINPTAATAKISLGLSKENAVQLDHRCLDLLDKGFTAEMFYLKENRHKRYSEVA